MPVRADEAVAALAVRAGVARGAPQRVVVPSLLRLVEQLVDHDGLHRRAIGRGAQIRQQADLVVQERRLVHAAGGGVGGAAGSMGRGAAATIQLRHPDGLAERDELLPDILASRRVQVAHLGVPVVANEVEVELVPEQHLEPGVVQPAAVVHADLDLRAGRRRGGADALGHAAQRDQQVLIDGLVVVRDLVAAAAWQQGLVVPLLADLEDPDALVDEELGAGGRARSSVRTRKEDGQHRQVARGGRAHEGARGSGLRRGAGDPDGATADVVPVVEWHARGVGGGRQRRGLVELLLDADAAGGAAGDPGRAARVVGLREVVAVDAHRDGRRACGHASGEQQQRQHPEPEASCSGASAVVYFRQLVCVRWTRARTQLTYYSVRPGSGASVGSTTTHTWGRPARQTLRVQPRACPAPGDPGARPAAG